MLTLFKNAQVYAPQYLGKKDILTGGKTILAIADHIEPPIGVEVQILIVPDYGLCPGLSTHMFILPVAAAKAARISRMPELQMSMMIEAGVTTVIGCLGTDGITRTVESVLMKVKTLRRKVCRHGCIPALTRFRLHRLPAIL